MSSKFKSKARLSSSDSDSEPEYKPKEKKQKKEKKPEKAQKSGGEDDHMYALSATRFINVREFRGKVLVDIREYYNNSDGDLKPGKKGISLTADQWRKLVDKVEEVNESISEIS
ncbi:activated RNA polymerase II transcriptional coactivator p15-like [Amphiura filiformis]|uniref:activated RNA polymerase II transcriptional coactivator p15-like n=1 Tax=Amphiura filiformis TaxID=82378 RepID=UPI003B21C7F2